jgi:hypothetical protein
MSAVIFWTSATNPVTPTISSSPSLRMGATRGPGVIEATAIQLPHPDDRSV